MTITILILISLITQAVTYIDPDAKLSGDGSALSPFKAVPATITAGDYRIKAGTTITTAQQLYIRTAGVYIGKYGKGVAPKISYTGSGAAIRIEASNVTIDSMEVDGNRNAHSLVMVMGSVNNYLTNVVIQNCNLHNAHNPNNAGFGLYSWYTDGLVIQSTYIRDVALDGAYCRNTPNIQFRAVYISDINKRYFINKDQKYSSGDAIQLDGFWDGFLIAHCDIRRINGAGNKFNVILASAAGVSDNATGVIEYCTFETDYTVTSAVLIERGRGIIVRYNTFEGSTQGIRVAGKYCKDVEIYGNVFINCSNGVGVGATYPGGYPATGTKVYDNEFLNISKYHIWTDKSTVLIWDNTHEGKAGSIVNYNYGGGSFVEIK